ncbi:MAG: M28 family peptidase [Anaerolineae bacterium]|nr:M28 family peptidase [Anaerolineae bacterium]
MTHELKTDLMRHLQHMAGEIGPRYGGSPGNQAAAAYIEQVFRRAGLDVEVQDFAMPAWVDNSAELWLDGERLTAVPNTFSPPCEVTATAVPACTLAELERVNITGRIVILYGELTKNCLSAKAWFLLSDAEKRLIDLLEAGRPQAVITVQTRPGDLERIVEDAEFILPSATVDALTGAMLLTNPNAALRLRIDTVRSDGRAANIVARKPGTSGQKVVLCAHYDTKVDTPGAFDNGSGTAVLLTLAQRLSQQATRHTLEFVAFSNEEYLPLGDDEYVRRGEGEFGRMVTAVNIDGVGQTLATNTITMLAHSDAFQSHITNILQDFPGLHWVEPWYASNHYTFFSRGVPSIALCSNGGLNHIHLRADTLDWMSAAKLTEVMTLVETIINTLPDQPLAWFRAENQP